MKPDRASAARQQAIVDEKQEFTTDVQDLLLLKRRGHLDKWQYSSSEYDGDPVKGAQLWADMLTDDPAYTLPNEEIAVIGESLALFSRFAGKMLELIDFGPGSVQAFKIKTTPLINSFQVSTYRPIDVCGDFLREIGTEIAEHRPDLKVISEQNDFLADNLKPADQPAVVYWGGTGFGNIGTGNPPSIPAQEIKRRLGRILKLVGRHGGLCLITLDTNQDPKHLLEAYNHPTSASFTANILERVKRDTDIKLKPEGFRYEAVWQPQLHLVEHRLVATASQTVELSGRKVPVQEGDYFVANHSFKLPAEYVGRSAIDAGWKTAQILGRRGGAQILMLST